MLNIYLLDESQEITFIDKFLCASIVVRTMHTLVCSFLVSLSLQLLTLSVSDEITEMRCRVDDLPRSLAAEGQSWESDSGRLTPEPC